MSGKTQIRFWGMTSLPMYGTSVEELHLDINGERYVVRVEDGKPVIEAHVVTGHYNPTTGELQPVS